MALFNVFTFPVWNVLTQCTMLECNKTSPAGRGVSDGRLCAGERLNRREAQRDAGLWLAAV